MDERSRMLWLPRSISRRQLILGAGAAMIVGAAACGGDDDDDDTGAAPGTGTTPTGSGAPATGAAGTPTPGGTLRVGIVGSTNDVIDGQYIVTKTDQARLVAGWETLVNYDADFNISYEHGLAEEIETKAADLYVVRLKEGILFHGGQPVTADDVIYSFQRRLDAELGLAPALIELLDPSGLTKVDERTVEIQLKQPAVTFINGLAEYTATDRADRLRALRRRRRQPDRHRSVHPPELHAGRRERAHEEPRLLGRGHALPRRGADHRLRRRPRARQRPDVRRDRRRRRHPVRPGERRRGRLQPEVCWSRRPAAGW